jgi:hypothetical protein
MPLEVLLHQVVMSWVSTYVVMSVGTEAVPNIGLCPFTSDDGGNMFPQGLVIKFHTPTVKMAIY